MLIPYQTLFEIARLRGVGNRAMTEYDLWKAILIDLGGTYESAMLKSNVMRGILTQIGGDSSIGDELILLRRMVTTLGGTWTPLDTKPRLLQTILSLGGF